MGAKKNQPISSRAWHFTLKMYSKYLTLLGIAVAVTIAEKPPQRSSSEATTSSPSAITCGIYTFGCVNKCRCRKGFARDYEDVCIPVKCCPGNTVCPMNEEYDMRIPSCPPQMTCDDLFDKVVTCGQDEIPTYIPGCRCKRGYVRLGTRYKCVLPNECCSEPNMVLVQKPNPCPGNTCQQPEFSKSNLAKKEWGWRCKAGHVKEMEDSYGCIQLSECKNDTHLIKNN